MREKEELEVGKTVGIICLVLIIAAILVPLIKNYLKENIKVLNNDMRIDYVFNDEEVIINIDSKNADYFKCYYGLEENNMIEVEMFDRVCTISTKNIIIGQKYYYKIVAYKNKDYKMFEKIFSKDYNVKLDYTLKDKCLELGYCSDNEVIYIKDNDTLYAVYKKDEERNTILGIAINNFISYDLNEEDLTNFEPSKISEFLLSEIESSSLNKHLIAYQFENDILEKGKLIDEKFSESKVNLLSWFDFENIKNYEYFKYVTTLLGSYQVGERNNIEYHYPIYVTGKESRVLKNMKNEIVTIAPVVAISKDTEIKSGFGTIDEPFILY